MKGFTTGVKWAMAAALLVAMPAVSAFAAKTTPATDKNTNVPAVPRAIPDLIPYHKFDPPKSKAFDINKLTVSGDMRVRPEFRTVKNFSSTTSNDFFTQQLVRLGLNYDISPDVAFFLQAQVASTFGASNAGINPNTSSTTLFMRQGFMLVRNFIAKDLTMKAGRQLVVWGNHRIFGHFDWNNVGFAFDGVTFRFNHKQFPIETGWIQVSETDCGQNGGGCGAGSTKGTGDGNILFFRVPTKIAGVTFEPAFIAELGGAAGNNANPHGGQFNDAYRYTMGARAAMKKNMFDVTFEGYYQTGKSAGPTATGRNLDIDALALHIDAGITLPVPMQPRIGFEANYSPGDGDAKACNGAASDSACNGTMNTFSQLFPTNHIHFGYMDRNSWQNMEHYEATIQMRPTKSSHFEIQGHIHRRANKGDFWYGANQASGSTIGAQAGVARGSKNIGQELDFIYTLFFQGNKVGWQTGYGVFFADTYIDQVVGSSANNQSWGYTQLWVNF